MDLVKILVIYKVSRFGLAGIFLLQSFSKEAMQW